MKLQDLAQQLGVSAATVSRALAGHPTVSTVTTQRVCALANSLGYSPNGLAAGLRKGRSNSIGVLVPHLRNNFFASVVTGIEERVNQAGYQLLICQSADQVARERQSLAMLLHAQVAGVLVAQARTTHHTDHFEQLRLRRVPLVFFDRFQEGYEGSAVVVDDRAGAYQATRHLLAQGYRRVAHAAGPQHLNIYQKRRLGYEDALREAGLPVEPALLVSSNLELADGVATAHQLLAQARPPDAIFSASDFAALGIMQALKARGLRMPTDVGVVGFGNELFAAFTEPALTSVSQHGELMGQSAAHALFQLLEHRSPQVAQHLVLQPTLLARASSQRRGLPA